jgi:GT2 family glycosyltransferase
VTDESIASLSVVVICLDEARYIEGCLTALAASLAGAPVRAEIVVVDGGSTDGTRASIQRWCRARIGAPPVRLVCSSAGYGRQRNAGVRAAAGTWVAFVSADVRVPWEWANEVVRALGPHQVLIGRLRLVAEGGRGRWMRQLTPTVYASTEAPTVVERCTTVHLIVQRSVLLRHPFDEALAACEDKDLAMRLAQRSQGVTWAELEPRVEHLARETFRRFLAKVRVEAQALARLAARDRGEFPDLFGWRHHCLRAAGAVALAAGALGLAIAAGRPVLGLAAALCGVVVGGFHSGGWRHRRVRGVPIALAARHIVTMWAVVVGYGRGWLLGPVPRQVAQPTEVM